MKLLVLRRCVLESSLSPEECSTRLRRATRWIRPPLTRWRPLTGRVSADRFAVRAARKRTLPPRARGILASGSDGGTEIRVDLGVAVREAVAVGLVAAFFGVGLVTTDVSLDGLLFAALAVTWLGFLAVVMRRWNHRADDLVACLCAVCEAEPAQFAAALG